MTLSEKVEQALLQIAKESEGNIITAMNIMPKYLPNPIDRPVKETIKKRFKLWGVYQPEKIGGKRLMLQREGYNSAGSVPKKIGKKVKSTGLYSLS